MARVQVIKRVSTDDIGENNLELQWCRYLYDDGTMEYGYRYIWVSVQGKLLPQRGQARLPSLAVAKLLMKKAEAADWGGYDDRTQQQV